MNSEQLALLDFLILARAEKFVGFGPSTFSFYLREHRMLHGAPPQQSVLVNASKIGTDEVFSRSARWATLAGSRVPDGGGLCQMVAFARGALAPAHDLVCPSPPRHRIALGSPDPFPSNAAAGGGDAQAAGGTTTT